MNNYVWVFTVFFLITVSVLAVTWTIIEFFGITKIVILLAAGGAVGLVAVIIEWISERAR